MLSAINFQIEIICWLKTLENQLGDKRHFVSIVFIKLKQNLCLVPIELMVLIFQFKVIDLETNNCKLLNVILNCIIRLCSLNGKILYATHYQSCHYSLQFVKWTAPASWLKNWKRTKKKIHFRFADVMLIFWRFWKTKFIWLLNL